MVSSRDVCESEARGGPALPRRRALLQHAEAVYLLLVVPLACALAPSGVVLAAAAAWHLAAAARAARGGWEAPSAAAAALLGLALGVLACAPGAVGAGAAEVRGAAAAAAALQLGAGAAGALLPPAFRRAAIAACRAAVPLAWLAVHGRAAAPGVVALAVGSAGLGVWGAVGGGVAACGGGARGEGARFLLMRALGWRRGFDVRKVTDVATALEVLRGSSDKGALGA